MKKLIYLIVVIVALGLIVAGCLPTVPPTGQNETSNLMKAENQIDVTVELMDSDGNPLEDGIIKYRGKPDSPTKWSFFGTTNADGQAIKELKASKWEYWFSVKYNDTYAKIKQNITEDNTVSFTTTSVTLWFSGDITYNSKVNPGTWIPYEGSMEMLPGTYAFRFGDESHPWASTEIEVSGNSVVKTVAYIRLLNSDGTPQTNYTADWIDMTAPPYAPVAGTPGANGVLLNVMDGYKNKYYAYHRVEYLNAQSYKPLAQIPALNSFYDFQLTEVTVQLKDHAGNLVSGTGPDVWFYTYYSRYILYSGNEIQLTLNNGTVSVDLLQGYRHYFTIKDYNGTKQMIGQYNFTNPVVFQTFLVVDNGWGCTNYSQFDWPLYGQTFPDTGKVELLPKFRTYYKNDVGATQWFDVLTGGKTLDLSTGSVTP